MMSSWMWRRSDSPLGVRIKLLLALAAYASKLGLNRKAAVHLSLGRIPGRAIRLTLTGGLMLGTISTSALARDREIWRCDAPNGHYDETAIPISEKSAVITGRIIIHKADFRPEWNSLARVSIKQSGLGDGGCHCSGIVVYAFPHPNTAEFHVTANGKHEAVAQSRFETPVTFKIALDPQGVMTVELGETDPVVKTVNLPYPNHNSLVLSCSGADVGFLNIDVR